MIKHCPVPLDGWRRLCHDGAVAKLEFKSCGQDNWLRIQRGQKLKARVGKPAILGTLEPWEKANGKKSYLRLPCGNFGEIRPFLWNLRSFEFGPFGE